MDMVGFDGLHCEGFEWGLVIEAGDEQHQSNSFRSVCALVVRNVKAPSHFCRGSFLKFNFSSNAHGSTREQINNIY